MVEECRPDQARARLMRSMRVRFQTKSPFKPLVRPSRLECYRTAPTPLDTDVISRTGPHWPGAPWISENLYGQGLLTLACLQDLSQARARSGSGSRWVFLVVREQSAPPGHRRHAHARSGVTTGRSGRFCCPLREHISLVVTPPVCQRHVFIKAPAQAPHRPGPQPARRHRPADQWCPATKRRVLDQLV